MPRVPDKVYLERLSHKTDFMRDPLEKAYRLLELLGAITSAPDIKGKLVLKGGTALQFISEDVREMNTEKISNIDEQDVRRQLVPMLQRKKYRVDLDVLKESCMSLVEHILELSEDEREFYDKFYEEKIFKQELLFGDVKVDSDLSTHPGVQWRLRD